MRTQRPVSAVDFELETLEPRLLLDGVWDASAAPTGGNWNTAANWVGGVVPTGGQITIAGLTGGQVVFNSGTANITSLTVTSSTLSITGGSMTVTGAGSTISAGSTLNVAGGVFNLETTGTLTNRGTITIGTGGVVNVRNGTLESLDAQIQLTSTAALNVERSTASQNPMLWLNSTVAPPASGLTATDSSLITLGVGGTFRVGSSVMISGTAGLVQTGGTIDFKPINNPGASPAPQNGFINALASTKAVAIDLQAGLVTGTGQISSKNASLGVTLQPGGAMQGTLEFRISGTTTFATGAKLDVQFFNGSYDSAIFTDPVAGAGTYQIVINDLEIVGSTTVGFTFPEGNGYAARVLGFDGIPATITGAVTQMNPLTPAVTSLSNPNFGLMPAVAVFDLGISYVSRHMDLDTYYLWVGPANGDWNDAANWKRGVWDNPEAWSYGDIFASWFPPLFQPNTATTAPTFFSNVVIPDSGSPNSPGFTFGNPAAFTGYAYLNSLHLMPGNQLNVQSGQLYLRGHAFTGDAGNPVDGLKMIRSSLQGTLNLTGGTLSNHTIMEIGTESDVLGGATGTGGRLIVASGGTLIIYRSTDFSGGTVLTVQSDARLEILGVTAPTIPAQPGYSGSLNLGTQSLLIPQGATLLAAAITVTAPTVTIAGTLEMGLVYENTGTGVFSYLYGAFTVQGNLVLTATSATKLIVAGENAAQSDRIAASGNIVAGGTLTVQTSPFFGFSTSGTIYNILTAGGVITGAFATTLAPGLRLISAGGMIQAEVAFDSPDSVTIQDGLPALADLIRQMVTYFNLSQAQGGAYNLPVAGGSLDTMFGLSASLAVTTFELPDFATSGTTAQLYAALTAAGYTVTNIAGGYTAPGGAVIPDVPANSGVFILVRRTGTLLNHVGVAPGYAGPQFNTDTDGLLDGVAATNALTGALGWAATLTFDVTFGIKNTGEFILQRDLLVKLAIAGAGTISSSLTIGGQTVTATGTTAANVELSAVLDVSGFITYQPLDEVVDGLPDTIVVTADGTASVDLTATLGPVVLTYAADYTMTGITGTHTESLTGLLSLPGVATSDPTPVPTTISMSGSYDSVTNSWTLNASTNALTFHGLGLNGFLNLVLSPTAFVGSGQFYLGVSFLKGGSNPAATTELNLTTTVAFTTTGATLTETRNVANLSAHTETGGTLLAATATTSVVTNIAIDFATAAITGGLTLKAVSASVLPDAKYESLVSDTNADGAAFTLTYGIVSRTLSVTLDRLTVTFGLSAFGFHIDGIVLTYDRSNASTAQVLATLPSVSVNLMGLTTVAATGPPAITTSVTIGQNGFTLGNLTTTLSNVRIGNFLEFTSVTVSLSSIAYTQGAANAAGSFGFSNAAAKMYPGQSAVAVNLTGVNGSLALSGGPVWSLTAATFRATVGEAFYVAESNVALSYHVGDTSDQTVLTLANTAVHAVQFAGMNAPTRTINFRSGGVDFGNFQLTGATATIEDYLEFTGAAINVSDFQLNYSAGGGTSFSGSVGATFGTLTFFPTANFLYFTPQGIFAGYDFNNGGSSGAFTIFVTEFELTISTMLKIEANDVIIQPGLSTIMTLGTAKITSPKLAWLEVEIEDFLVTRTGFSIGTLDLNTAEGEVVSLPANAGTLDGVNFHITDLAYDIHDGLSGDIHITVERLVLMPGDPSFSLVATDLTGGYETTGTGASELTLTAGRVEAILHPQEILFIAVNIVFTPEASTILSIGNVSVSVDLAGTVLTGSGGNFEIHSDGSFAARPGFGVSFSLSTAPALLRFPGFLQIGLTKLGLSWPDFANDPGNFDLILSAFVTGLGSSPGGPTVTGVVNDLRISLSELRAGRMPIIDVGSGSITISGPLFGGTVSGTIAIGVIRLDANGSRIDATDTITPVASRVFFGAVRASFTFGGRSGFSLSFGLSELGPISAYMAINAHVLLHAPSGLTLKSLHAEIVFDSKLPDLTDASELDPDKGDELGFTPIAQLTDTQWLRRLELAVVAQANAPPSGDFWSAFSRTMVIKGRAEFISANSPEEVFRASVDLLFDTEGRMMVNGVYTLADKLDVQGRIYADLRDPANAVFLFFARYAPSGATELLFLGSLNLHITNTVVEFQIAGSVKMKKAGVNPTIVGTVLISYSDDQLFVRITGSLKLRFIGDVIGVDGIFRLDLTDANNPKFWGALNVQTNFELLENIGIYATGSAFFRINSTDVEHTETLVIPGQPDPVDVTIAPQTLSLLISGSLQIKKGAADWFNLVGEYGYEISSTRAVMVLNGHLRVGPTSSPFLTLGIAGFLQIDERGIAAFAEVSVLPNLPQITGIQLSGTLTFELNTMNTIVFFSTPTGTRVIRPFPPSAPGSPPLNGTIVPYAIIYGGATMVLGDEAVTVTATDLRFLLTTSGIVQMNVIGSMAFKVNGLTLFTYNISGGFQVDSAGVAAAFSVSLGLNSGPEFGFTAAFNSGIDFRFNSTNQARTIGATTLVAGIYASFTADMSFTMGGITLGGRFTISAGPTQLTVELAAGALGTAGFMIGGTPILTFGLAAGFSIINENATNRGIVLLASIGADLDTRSLGFEFAIGASYTLMLNTTSTDRVLAGKTLAAQTYLVKSTVSSVVTIAGVAFAVEQVFTAGLDSVRYQVTGAVELRAAGTRIFRFNLAGEFNIAAAGIWGVSALTIDATAPPPSGADISLSGTYVMAVNTTNTARTVVSAPQLNGTVGSTTLAAGPYVRVNMAGVIGVFGIEFSGTASLEASANFVAIQVSANFAVKVGGTTYFTFQAGGTLFVSATGVAARFALSLGSGTPSSSLGISIAGTSFGLELNTTGALVTLTNGETFDAGDYFRINGAGNLSLGGFTIEGTFMVLITPTGVGMSVSGKLDLKLVGTTIFSFNVAGAITVGSTGVAAALALDLRTQAPNLGVEISLTFRLLFNTTGQHLTLTLRGTPIIVEARGYAQLEGTGVLWLGGILVRGEFQFIVTQNISLTVNMQASLSVFGITTSVFGTLSLGPSGIYGSVGLQLPTLSGPGFSLSGTFSLMVNGTSSTVVTNAGSIEAFTYRIAIINAELSILGQTLRGSVYLSASANGTVTIEIPASNPLSLRFYTFGVVAVSGRIDSAGHFNFTGSLAFDLGYSSIISVGGTMAVTITDTGASGSFSGSLYVLGRYVAGVSGAISSGSFTFTASAYIKVPTLPLSLSAEVKVTVDKDGVSATFKTDPRFSSTFLGLNVSAVGEFNSWGSWYVKAGFLLRVGNSNLGAELGGSILVGRSFWGPYGEIKGHASVWASTTIAGIYIGGSLGVDFVMDFAGKVTISFSIAGYGFGITIDLGLNLRTIGSDIAGGYAFLDVNGDGVWQGAEARAPVDNDGGFSFNPGDLSTWKKDAGNTYAFQDLNTNGTWDAATEARVALVNGALPAVLIESLVNTGPAAPATPADALGLLSAYALVDPDTNVATLNPALGRIMVNGGRVVDPNTGAATAHAAAVQIALVTAGYTGLIDAGQVVFFDTNNNGILDAGEVSVAADANGFFTFNPTAAQLAALGILAGYDTNGNGRIDANEGSIVLAGGTDKSNGLPITGITRISAANVGTGLALSANPLTALQSVIVGRGFDRAAVNIRLAQVLGLPVGLTIETIDVQTGFGLTGQARIDVERIISQVETFQLNAVALLGTAGVATATAQQAAFDALADRVMRNFAANGTFAPADALDLTNLAELTALLTAAAAKAGVSPVAATTAAVAQITRELNLRAAAYAAATTDLTRDLARIDAVAKGVLKTAIGQLAAGTITPAAFIIQFSGANLTALLNGVTLVPVTPPTLTGVTDLTVPSDFGGATLNLQLAASTGTASDITLTASSSNPTFLTNTAIHIVGTGANRVLMIDSGGLGVGSATITLTATIGGQVTTKTLLFTVALPAPLPPIVVTTPVTSIVADSPYTYGFIAFPAVDGRTLVISAIGLPAWLTLTDNGNGTALLSGTPTLADLGGASVVTYPISVTATDNLGAAATQNFTLVLAESALALPTFDTTPTGTTLTPDQSFTYVVHVTPDASATGVTLRTASPLPVWLTFTDHGNGSGTLTGVPRTANIGNVNVVLVATDSNGLINVQDVNFVVQPALALAPVTNVTLAEDGSQTISLTIESSTPNPSLFVASSNHNLLPLTGLSLGGSGLTRTLTITPAANQSGTATITLTLTDGSFSVTQTFTVTVGAVDDPVVATGLPLPTASVPAGSGPIILNLTGFFASGDGPVTFTATGSDPALATISINGNTLTITPAANRSGLDLITLVARATGNSGQVYTASGVIRITVLPELSVSAPQVVRTEAGNVLRFTVTLLTPSNQTVRVGYATANGTAVAGVDFVGAAGTVEFAPGATSRTVDIVLVGDLLLNPGTFILGLSGAQNASVGTGSVTGTIPVDRGVLAGIRPPTLELSFSFLEFIGGTSTENDENVLTLRLESAPVATIGRASLSLNATGGSLTDLAPGDSLVDATSLSALGGLREMPRY